MRLPLACFVVTVASLPACLDLPPRVVPADAGVEVDGGPVVRPDGPSVCVTCIQAPDDPGPGCGTAWAPCAVEPRCVGLVECSEERNCFRFNNLNQFLGCVQPCVEKFMLAGTTDPVYPLVTPIVFCTTGVGVCAPICNVE